MTDTDPKMMRRQQDKDTPQTIEADETHAPKQRSDSDATSAADRLAARMGKGPAEGGAEDAVFEANTRSHYSAEAEVFEDGRTDAKPPLEKPPLAKKDRSLLGE